MDQSPTNHFQLSALTASFLSAMDHSQAKMTRCIHTSTHYLGRLISLLSDKRDKYAATLQIRDVKVHTSYSLLYIVGKKGSNKHINVMVVSRILPPKREDDSNLEVKSFLEALSRGTVTELRGSLVVELSLRLIYMNIVKAKPDIVLGGDRDDTGTICGLRLMVVDSGGECFCWHNDLTVTPTTKDHGWRYMTNFRIYNTVRYGERLIRLQYDQSNGEVVFVSRRDGPNLGGYCEAPVYIDEVSVCSLHFTGPHIQLSRCVTLCTLSQVQNVHYSVHGIWIVCSDCSVHYYDYHTSRMLKYNGIQAHASAFSTMDTPIISTICSVHVHTDLVEEQAQRLYVLVQDTLYTLQLDGQISRPAVYSLKQVLHHRSTGSGVLMVHDMHVPVEQTPSGGTVVSLITSERCYALQLPSPRHSMYEPYDTIPPAIAVRKYVVIDIPKLRRHSICTAPACFIPLPERPPTDDCVVALICRGACVFALQIASTERAAASPERHPYRGPFHHTQATPVDQLWKSLFMDRAPSQQQHSSEGNSTSPHVMLSQPARAAYMPSVSSIFADSTLKQLLTHANSASANSSAAVLSLEETLHHANSLFSDAGQFDTALLAQCSDAADSVQVQGPLTVSLIRSILVGLQRPVLTQNQQAGNPRSSIKREVSMPNIRRENVDLSARHWFDELNIRTLQPPHSPDAHASTSEYLSRAVEPLLLMQLSQSLQPHSDVDDNFSDTANAITLLDVVLRIVALTRPCELVSLVHALVEIEQQSAMRGRHADKTVHNSSAAPSNKSHVHSATVIRTVVGAPPVDASITLVPTYIHLAPPRHSVVEDDDDIFGISTVVQRQQEAQRPVLNLQIRHRLKNLSRTEYTSSGDADKDLEKHDNSPDHLDLSSREASDADIAAEGSGSDGDVDGDDAFGVFRDVGDEESDSDQGPTSPAPAVASVDPEHTAGAEVAIGTAAATAKQLQRVLTPLLAPTFSIDATAEGTVQKNSSCSSALHTSLLDRCANMAMSLLQRHLRSGSEEPKLTIAQEDGLLSALLQCGGGVVNVAEYLIQARRFKALTILALRVAASANVIHTPARDPLTTAYYTEGRGRLVREADQAAIDSNRPCQDSRGAIPCGDALIGAVLSADNNLPTVVQELTTFVPNRPTASAVPHIRELEAIVVFKLALKCFLGKQVLVEIYFSHVQELLRFRPEVITVEVARAWVSAFAVSTEHRDKILRTCTV